MTSSPSLIKTWMIPAGAVLCCLLPFAGKAFHMDDPLFLWSARQIQESPFDFYGVTVNWTGQDRPLSEVTQNPPLTAYYLAAAATLFGWNETALHIAFLIPALGATLGTFFLARLLCGNPLIATLIGALTPVFLVSSSNVMCDASLLAFWVWSVFFWIRGIRENRSGRLLISSVLAALAVWTKFFGICLVPLLLAFTWMERKKLSPEPLFLLIPLAALAGYEAIYFNLYGRGHFLEASLFSKISNAATAEPMILKLLIGLSFAGGCYAVIMFYAPLIFSKRLLVGVLPLYGIIIAILVFSDVAAWWPPFPKGESVYWPVILQWSFWILSGTMLIRLAILDFWKSRDSTSFLLSAWIVGTFTFASGINWAINARSFLPMMPAVGILLARRLEAADPSGSDSSFGKWQWPLAPALLLSLLVVWADYRAANDVKKTAQHLVGQYGKPDQSIWFMGHWGFQYYMQKLGAKPLDLKQSPVDHDDLAVIPKYNVLDRNVIFPSKHLQWKAIYKQPAFPGAAAMNFSLGAGFYSYSWGPLPFAFGPTPETEFTILKIKR